MARWHVHYANACGQLDGLIGPIGKAIEDARQRAERVTPPLDLDVVVQAWPGHVIPETGFVGTAPTGTMIHLMFDPASSALAANLGEPLSRMVAHELHHVHRHRGRGHGGTLGDALVSEGLAGQFCRQLYRSLPELWEKALAPGDLVRYATAARADWNARDYDHARWFFGTGDLPRWTGYSLGYALVGRFIATEPQATAATLIDAPAAAFHDTLNELLH